MLLIYLLNNFQQQHPVAFDTFIADFSRICLLRQMNRRLEKHPYVIDAFIVYFSSIMFAKTNGWILG